MNGSCLGVLLLILPAPVSPHVLPSTPAYAEIEAPANAFTGREEAIVIRLRESRGNVFSARPRETFTLVAEGDTSIRRIAPPEAFEEGVARMAVRFSTPGFVRFLLEGEDGRRFGRSLMIQVALDPRLRARGFQVILPGGVRVGESVAVQVVPVDIDGHLVGGFDLPSYIWTVETSGVRVRVEDVTGLHFQDGFAGFVVTPLETGRLRLSLREGGSGLEGASEEVEVEGGLFARMRADLPPYLRAGEPALLRLVAEERSGLPAALPEGFQGATLRLRGTRGTGKVIPPRFDERLFSGLGPGPGPRAEGWILLEEPGEIRLEASPETAGAHSPGLYAILRVGPSSFRFLADAPADSCLVSEDTGGIRLEWREGAWRGGEETNLRFGDLSWDVEEVGPPLRLRLAGAFALEGKSADRNTFRIDIREAVGQDARESDWGMLIRSGRYGEARARISSHLAEHPEDTKAAEVLERLERLERILR